MALKSWRELPTGCVVFEPGSASEYHTGSWRSQRPVWNNQKCIKCGICYVFCPEGCVQQGEDGFFQADMDYCKGCGICAHECWPRAIAMIEEG
ncbi:MAG: pyruvate ferredoxin oxidoreductase [Deltaproteobacteria bacterium HGW-Deltaproteobacteria-13]|nr:MAG: pyruvate ferredoxin oxidoreductase [Deltaproteobacteria bacterium HGW-Deltaproteobacteria-13]